jgi:hypothetical protein
VTPRRATTVVFVLLLALGLLWLLTRDRALSPPADKVPGAADPANNIATISTSQQQPSAPQKPPSKKPPTKFEQAAHDGDQVQIAGAMISMGQKLALGEAIAQNAANAEKYVDQFCEENAKLSPLPAAGTSADAAAFMAPRMDYEKPLDQPPGSLHLPDELRARLRDPNWLTKVSDADLQRDFSWMTELAQFDHWSLLGAGRLRDHVLTDAPHASIPNYSSVIGWAKLRYALAVRRSDLAQAQIEVRHFADLMRSQGILMAEACALLIYGLEAQVQAPGAFDAAELKRRKDLDFAAIDFADPGVDPSVARKAMECARAPCVAMAEAVVMNKSLSAAAGGDNLAMLNELASARGCQADLFERINGTREYQTAEALSELAGDLPQEIPRRLGLH